MQPWQRMALIAIILGLPILVVGGYGLFKAISPNNRIPSDAYEALDWNKLRQLDLDTGFTPSSLEALDGQRVKIPGFIVPLDDDATTFSEFLLVPSPQACIHVPPPPSNQMVLVRMDPSKAPQRSWRPIWLQGRLQITVTESFYGNTSYRLYGEGWEYYEIDY